MTDEIPIVVIKTMHRHYYFQWFLLDSTIWSKRDELK